ncbi:CUB domain,Peptidase S1A, chymotrypsin family,Serine proteases, trypsin family, serine active [Cinara cedri]|uniref:limulus clotting factor C n=1 Tax=Cinara cedri TaxID=506608 RepID=A0A5E4NTB4_9HEMI|nr:CUB domain,Peptidase S1A, chymotrypsin family,Serine proteases, trypsin family, serine active [Cinara cedri]
MLCCVRSSVRANGQIDSMTLLNATNFIMRHQRYLQESEHAAATVVVAAADNDSRTSGNDVNLDIDGNVEDDAAVNNYSPLVLTNEVCDPGKCHVGKTEGVCISGESCFKHGGQVGNFCNGSSNLICCTFLLTCGDVVSQKVTYLQSPDSLKIDSGGVACDYDVMVQKNTCAVRVDYEKLHLAGKIGGVCDIDQVYILNSNDGPTTGQCGQLSGYSTVVAVEPNQAKPLKIALVVQSEPADRWSIKVSQIDCNEIKPFKESPECGRSSAGSLDGGGGGGGIVTGKAISSHPTLSLDSAPCDNKSKGRPRWRRSVIGGSRDDRPARTPSDARGHYRTATVGFRREHPDDGRGDHNRRIIGGTDAEIGEHTWQVAIALNGVFFCGGALISDRIVITAAHCVMTHDTPLDKLTVHLGDYDLTTDNETEHQVRKVSRAMFHSHFHPFLLANDVALLQLDRPVNETEKVRPVCLPAADAGSYVGEKATVVGWGITSFPSGDPSPALQKLSVEVLSNFQCSRVIDDHVGLGMMCAAAPSLQGTCFGDSGGPLTLRRDTGQNVLIGLVSYGLTGCAVKPAFPDLYTRISEYAKWIDVSTTSL